MNIKKISETLIYDGWIKIKKKVFNTGMVREIVVGKEATAIAIYNKIGMILVKQYRASVEKYTWEIPAGVMDVPDEDPINTIIREVQEETGLNLNKDRINKLMSYYPAIGHAEGLLHLFSAKIKDEYPILPEINDADVIEVKFFKYSEIQKMINEENIIDGKTILIFYKIINFISQLKGD